MRAWVLVFVLCAAVTEDIANADVVEATNGLGGSYTSTSFANGQASYQQWTVGSLTCYVAKGLINGVMQVVKQCRNGLLGTYHDMTYEEEEIMKEEMRRIEEQKIAFKHQMAAGTAVMRSNMRSMNNQIQRSLQGMHNTMRSMQNMMQKQMQDAFAAFG